MVAAWPLLSRLGGVHGCLVGAEGGRQVAVEVVGRRGAAHHSSGRKRRGGDSRGVARHRSASGRSASEGGGFPGAANARRAVVASPWLVLRRRDTALGRVFVDRHRRQPSTQSHIVYMFHRPDGG